MTEPEQDSNLDASRMIPGKKPRAKAAPKVISPPTVNTPPPQEPVAEKSTVIVSPQKKPKAAPKRKPVKKKPDKKKPFVEFKGWRFKFR